MNLQMKVTKQTDDSRLKEEEHDISAADIMLKDKQAKAKPSTA